MARVHKQWYGDAIKFRAHRAAGRAIVGLSERVAAETKEVSHVISGTLRRSVHAAPRGYDGSSDEFIAQNNDMGGTPFEPTQTATGAQAEVGSWVAYACAEWIGRGHPGVTQGLELARVAADTIVRKAFEEEGL